MSYSVCLFGDSVAKGVIFDSIRRKYRVIKDCFAASMETQEHLRVTNYSKFGCTITKGRELLERHAAELSSYDFVVFEFGLFNWPGRLPFRCLSRDFHKDGVVYSAEDPNSR